MINNDDYKSYYKENKSFLELLHKNDSVLYNRLNDVYKVLEYISLKDTKHKNLDDDLVDIFNTGFSYFHEQLELIKLFFNKSFQSDYQSFKDFEVLINYLLYIEDLSEALSEKELLSQKVKQTLQIVSLKIELIMQTKVSYTNDDLFEFDAMINSCIPPKVEILTTDMIFSSIVEELQL